MKNSLKTLILAPCLLAFFSLSAQEICDNGVDDDDNGFIDCFDPDCSAVESCLNSYFGQPENCQTTVTPNPEFNIRLQWASDNTTAFSSVTPAIGDIDGDGTPEVVTTNRYLNTVSILDGATGHTKFGPLDVGFDIAKTVAIANIDRDDCAEIFVRGHKKKYLAAFDCQLNELWRTTTTTTRNSVSLISLADFNGDGQVELLHGIEIRNAHTGEAIIEGNANFKKEVTYGTIALDILPDEACTHCAGLEIIDGGKIYAVDIASGSRTLERDLNSLLPQNEKYAIKLESFNRNTTSVADYNLDGHIDVIFSAGQYENEVLFTTVFFWDVANFSYTTFTVPENHTQGTGRLNIADIDGDGQLNCSFVSDERIFALDEKFELLYNWGTGGYITVKEGSSGFTGCTVFDFNGDNAAEIIYRGEDEIHIIDGITGESRKKIKCVSRTAEEYPIIADVDGDGATEICVSCNSDDNLSFTPYSNGQYGQIRVYEADGNEHWQSSRSVWNQHAYFNVNINDDLTVPRTQQDMATVFSSNICSAGEKRPLNAFLNQSPLLDENGCPNPVSADIEVAEIKNIVNNICQQGSLELTMIIKNSGAATARGLLPITFYDGAPDQATSTRLNTISLELISLEQHDAMAVTTQVEGIASEFDLYISLNDEGLVDPPVSTINRIFPECNSENNLFSISTPESDLVLSSEVISDNEKCDPTKPDNGDAKVFLSGTISEIVETLWKEDFEDLAPGTLFDNGLTSWEFTQRPSDPRHAATYFTSFNHKLLLADLGGEVIWQTHSIDISGQEEVRIAATVSSSTNFVGSGDTFEIFYRVDGGSALPMENGFHNGAIGSTTARAAAITGNMLQVFIKANNDGNKEVYYLDDLIIEGVNDIVQGEITAGYDFNWHQNNDFDNPVFVGNRYTGLATGEYQIVASSRTNSCVSDAAEISIANIQPSHVIGIDKTQDLSHCITPNGILDAYVIESGTQITTGYDFKWFVGNDFTSVVSVGPRADHLEARTYSAVVTKKTSGCESTLSEDVSAAIVPIEVQITQIEHITGCVDLNTGSISVTANGETDGFIFNWYNGPNTKATPDVSGAALDGATYSSLTVGTYTVTAYNENTQCTSLPVQEEVLDKSTRPNIAMTLVPNTSCGVETNGMATAEIVGEQIEDYTFSYYKGVSTLPENKIFTTPGTSGQVANALDPGQYLIEAIALTTGCTNTQSFVIVDDPSYPDLPPNPEDHITISHAFTCNGAIVLDLGGNPTGAIDASLLKGQLDQSGPEEIEYYFELYTGANSTGTPIAENLTGVFGQLPTGTFTLSILNNLTGCPAEDLVLAIESLEQAPTIVREEKTDDEYCINGNGTQRITANTSPAIGEPVGGYEFTLFDGSGTTAPQYTAPILVINGDFTFEQLEDGMYTVQVTNLDNGCTSVASFDIADISDVPQLAAPLITNNQDCSGLSPTGSIEGSVFNNSKENYRWTWYDNMGNPISGKIDVDGSDPEANLLVNFENSSYAVEVQNKVTGCIGLQSNIIIDQQPEYPVINLFEVNPNTNCAIGNGSLSADVGPGNETDGYTFEWFLGTDDSTTPLMSGDDIGNGSSVGFSGNNSNIITGLHTPAGLDTYTVRVTNNQTACQNLTTITLANDLTTPVISLASSTPVTTCQGSATHASGQIEMTNVSEPDFGDPASDYTYTWYFGTSNNPANKLSDGENIGTKKGADAVGVLISGAQTQKISGLDAGFYTVEAINSSSGCISAPFTVELTENIAPIAIQASVLQDDFSCDINTPTGEITADIFGGNTGYRLEWYAGTNTIGTPIQQTIENTNVIGGLSAGTYTLLATNLQTNCSQTATEEVIRSIPIYTLTGAQTPQNNCTPNGRAMATPNAITYSYGIPKGHATGANPLDYTYEWYVGQIVAPGLELAETSNTLRNQWAGHYTVVATENTSGCSSNPLTIDIGDGTTTNAPTADIRAFGIQAISNIRGVVPGSCNENDGVILANITANPNGNELALTWYAGSDDYTDGSGTELVTNSTNVNGTGTSAYAALGAAGEGNGYPSGLYSLLMKDLTTGCIYQQVFDLPFNGQQTTTTLSIDHVDECPDNGVARVGMGDNISITYSDLVDTFDDGEMVTAPSGAFGVVSNDNGANSMQISTSSTITFAVKDVITGQLTNASATIATLTDVGNTAFSVDDIALYDIYLFVGDGVPAGYSPAYDMISGSTVSVGAQVEFTGLPSGTYTAVAREKSGELGGGECYSAAFTDEILQNAYAPIIATRIISDNTICDYGSFGGNASIKVTARKNSDDPQPNDFEFKWYKVGEENPGDELEVDFDSTFSTLTNQPPGDYIVYIDRLGLAGLSTNSCQVTATYTIQNNPEIHKLSVSDAIIEDCNGTGTVTILDQITDNASDYTYTWYQDSYEAGSIIGGQTSATLSGQVAGTYFVEAIHNTNGCITPAVEFSIDQTTAEPIVTATANPNTFCNTANLTGNGDLTLNIDRGTNPLEYMITWYRGSDPATDVLADNLITATANENSNQGTAVIAGISNKTISGLSSGNYLVHVIDNTSPGLSCDTYATFAVGHAPETPTIDNANINPVSDCGGMNGTISIENSHITGDIADYTFTWFSVLPTIEIVGENAAQINGLVAGTYLIEGTHLITGCRTNRFPVAINDVSENPTVDLVVNTIDISCDPDNFEGNGSLGWSITNPDGGTYSYQWYAGTTVDFGTVLTNTGSISGTSGVGVTASIGSLSGIDGGTYTLRITDSASPNNTCHADATLTLPETIPDYTVNASANTPNANCTNFNGTFEITDIAINEVSSGIAGFDFNFTKANDDPHGGTHTASAPLITDLSPGSYQVTFTHQDTQCPGNALDFIIEDRVVHPSVEIVLDQADEYCIGGNGQLTAIVDATTLGNFPSYQWTPSGETTATIAGLDQSTNETHSVTVTDPITGCSTAESYELPFVPTLITINPETDVVIQPATICTGTPDGSISISSISPGAPGDYTYKWFRNTYNATGEISGQVSATLNNLEAGTYYMEAQSTFTGCTSGVLEFEVEESYVYPEIHLIDFSLSNDCKGTNPNGSLTVGISDGAGGFFPDSDYQFSWTGGNSVGLTSFYSDLSEGTYQVSVENNTSGCTSIESYGMQSEELTLLLDLDLTGNENCVDPIGRLVINVLNPTHPTATYEYYLAPGKISLPNSITQAEHQLKSNLVDNLESGPYTVFVLDSDRGCSSEPTPATVDDLRNTTTMQMQLTQDKGNTYCDPALADGQATVSSVPEEPSRYTFYWYDGPSLTDLLLDSALSIYNLVDQEYAIQMIDRYTGCTIDDIITISYDGIENTTPLVTKESNRTDCLNPNGAGSVSVEESIADYVFEWRDSDDNILSTDSEIFGLESGLYYVTVLDKKTGCLSDAGVLEVKDSREDPVFSVEVSPSKCTELVRPNRIEYVGSGAAEFNFTTKAVVEKIFYSLDENQPIDTLNQDTKYTTFETLEGLVPGNYSALAMDENNCWSEGVFQIRTDIEIFNGVSDNGDGLNEYFRITCADQFPNNTLSIYNRSGALVYQTRGYEDHIDGKVFTGASNAGLGGGKSGLPVGTYFYVFDKGEGMRDDLYQGYLELIR